MDGNPSRFKWMEIHPVFKWMEIHPVFKWMEIHPVFKWMEIHPVLKWMEIPIQFLNGWKSIQFLNGWKSISSVKISGGIQCKLEHIKHVPQSVFNSKQPEKLKTPYKNMAKHPVAMVTIFKANGA
jgi:hypothetical protein